MRKVFRLLSAGLLCGLTGTAAAAEQNRVVQSVQAVAPIEARGRIVKSGPEEATFTGIVDGTIYRFAEADFTPVGLMSCAVMAVLDLGSGEQTVTGRCRLTGRDAKSEAYAEVSCEGDYSVGCMGDFELLSGSGRMADVKGRGELHFRTGFLEAARGGGSDLVDHRSTGLAWWPDFSLITPLVD